MLPCTVWRREGRWLREDGAERLHSQKTKRKNHMKLVTRIFVAVGMAAVLSHQTAARGDGKTVQEKVVVEKEARKWWSADLSTGWDSLYMFRGVNVLRFDQDGNKQKYGSSLYWTQLNVSFMPTENDTITLGSWMAFGIGNTRYKEFDGIVNYAHTFGDLEVGLGYIFYYYLNSVLYQNELTAKLAYTFNLPAGITLVPSLTYFFNLGPDFDDFRRGTGVVETASSYPGRPPGRRHPYLQGHHLPGTVVCIRSQFRFQCQDCGQ